MEKVERVPKTTYRDVHYFYCDDCGTYLGATEEYDDGWYGEKGKFELSFCVSSRWYRMNKQLCDECREKVLSKVADNLIQLGFENKERSN